MCGIAGFVSDQPLPRSLLQAMAASLRHRGPDDEGVGLWEGGGPADGTGATGRIGLAQERLAILDLSPLGHNPMAWDGGRLWVTHNGEIYNFRELRRELEKDGARFRSQTDTEVALAAYDRWGIDCLQRFAGMFAFALWDSGRGRLFLARDRLGKKPLYYAESKGRLLFASELKGLLADPDFPREVDPDAISLYLRYGYVPAPYSIFRHARKLLPGHYALYEKGRLTIDRYWDPVSVALAARVEGAEPEVEERLEGLLRESVRQRMISDVPVGAFLSGGIDSSLVVALMQEQSPRPVKTFTIRFENPEFNESNHAAAVAKHLGTDHHEETCGVSQMLEIVDVIPNTFDEPFADASAIPTYLLSRITRQHVTVALSGDGGDELFFGYPRYAGYATTRWLLESSGPLRRTAGALASLVPRRRFQRAAEVLRQEETDRYLRFVSWWGSQGIAQLTRRLAIENPVYSEARLRLASMSPGERPPVLDLVTYLPEDILTKVDRASMALSLEARSPFLDHRVVELALRLPLRMKWRSGEHKRLLRRILYRKVPRHLIDRPKMGFGVPLGDWLRGPLRASIEESISGAVLEDLGMDPTPARAAWRDFLAGRSHRKELLWNLYALIRWSKRWARAPA